MELKNELKTFNTVRAIAQTIDNEGFKREYQEIIAPILQKCRQSISGDDMVFELNEAICKINHLAITYQFIPNHAAAYRNGNKRALTGNDFSEHGKLMELEMLTNSIIFNQHKV